AAVLEGAARTVENLPLNPAVMALGGAAAEAYRLAVNAATQAIREHAAKEAEAQPGTVLDGLEPIQLRWGLNDVMWGADGTTFVMLSGPDGEPYRVELDAERTAVLRDCLAGPTFIDEAQQPTTTTAPRVGDRYTNRLDPIRTVTVTDVWTTDDGHTAVAYEWRANGLCGSACPIDVFHREYRPAPEVTP
ncbi:MAG TPA: hypothetical protein VIQ25_10735, partial [Gemmatimonadales bacterium]